ncbi:MAG: 3-phosphoshikimate 1-carboxyvinyltransferase [Verrucomicrobiales bacterium]|nr:3-phosphoshikimate 1-carboxyvinyltransferase [Verrucomicrobiales bacterium]
MVDALRKLGFNIDVAVDPGEPFNRVITVQGANGTIPNSGTVGLPLEIYVGNAGTAARFLSALVCLGRGVYSLRGTPRMHERPQAALLNALRQLGYKVESPNNKLPAVIHGQGPRVAACKIDIHESSQFASALLLCAKVGGWDVEVVGEDVEEAPYVAMTHKLIEAFARNNGDFGIEPDTSSASYFVAANWLVRILARETMEAWDHQTAHPRTKQRALTDLYNRLTLVNVAGLPRSDWQIDTAFQNFIPLPKQISRHTELGDSIMTAMVLAPFANQPTTFTDLQNLRLQECDRVSAMQTELVKCGVRVDVSGDDLTVFPSSKTLHGAEIETYDDHRMAMCFAIFGLRVSGIRLKNPSCVKKTFPNFFQKLATQVPAGLGAQILDAKTRSALSPQQLVINLEPST